MKRWIQYTKERFPLPVYLLLAAGYVLSGIALFVWPIPLAESIAGIALLLVFLFELRLMDEHKDREKDRIAHPERPIPRGLLSERAAALAISRGFVFMLFLVGALVVNGKIVAAEVYLALSLFLFLMYMEFFAGRWLTQRPFLYAATHQPIGIPAALLGVALVAPQEIFSTPALGYATATLGSFFGYEIGRKLDPNAHPVLTTYVVMNGHVKTGLVFAIAQGVAAVGLWFLQMPLWFVVIPLIVALSYLLLFWKPERFKVIEGFATLNLLVCLWAGFILHFMK